MKQLLVHLAFFFALAAALHVLCHFIYPIGFTPAALITAALILRRV